MESRGEEETVDTAWRQEETERLWTLHGYVMRLRDCGHCMETEELKRLWALYGDVMK